MQQNKMQNKGFKEKITKRFEENPNTTYYKEILRDYSSDSALNFHEIQDVCIFVMVLDV